MTLSAPWDCWATAACVVAAPAVLASVGWFSGDPPGCPMKPAPCSAQVGWMMWNWMVSMLATGGSLVLYDGSPLVPTPNVLWDLVDRIG